MEVNKGRGRFILEEQDIRALECDQPVPQEFSLGDAPSLWALIGPAKQRIADRRDNLSDYPAGKSHNDLLNMLVNNERVLDVMTNQLGPFVREQTSDEIEEFLAQQG